MTLESIPENVNLQDDSDGVRQCATERGRICLCNLGRGALVTDILVAQITDQDVDRLLSKLARLPLSMDHDPSTRSSEPRSIQEENDDVLS